MGKRQLNGHRLREETHEQIPNEFVEPTSSLDVKAF